VRLHREVASSGTRCSGCKPVVLVTLGGCHLLDAWWLEAPSKLARRLCEVSEKICEGDCAHPAGITKSNSSRARWEGRQVVQPGRVLELVVSTPCGRV
jgi:hypothetical protein